MFGLKLISEKKLTEMQIVVSSLNTEIKKKDNEIAEMKKNDLELKNQNESLKKINEELLAKVELLEKNVNEPKEETVTVKRRRKVTKRTNNE